MQVNSDFPAFRQGMTLPTTRCKRGFCKELISPDLFGNRTEGSEGEVPNSSNCQVQLPANEDFAGSRISGFPQETSIACLATEQILPKTRQTHQNALESIQLP
jgi:hypothetical protein